MQCTKCKALVDNIFSKTAKEKVIFTVESEEMQLFANWLVLAKFIFDKSSAGSFISTEICFKWPQKVSVLFQLEVF